MFEFKIELTNEDAKKLLEASLAVLKNVYNCDISYCEYTRVEETEVKTYDVWNEAKANFITAQTEIKPINITVSNSGKRCWHFDYSNNAVWLAGKQFDSSK